MAGVIAILRKALEQIALGRDSTGVLGSAELTEIARVALEDAARLSQDCLKHEQSPTPCEDEHIQYASMCC